MAPKAEDDTELCELPALHGGGSTGSPPPWWIQASLQMLTKGVNAATLRVNQVEENLSGQIRELSGKVEELTTTVATLVTQNEERRPAQLKINGRVEQLPTPDLCRECQELAVGVRTGRVAQGAANSNKQTVTARQALWVGVIGGVAAGAGVVIALMAWLHPFTAT
jgi:TolA-binding protein